MPGKSTDTDRIVSDDAIRQRAYFMWEADGRPEGRNDHYWHLAHAEATRALVEETTARTARAAKGRNPSTMPPEVKARAKGKKSEAKAPRKEPKPRAAVQKAP